MFKKLIILFLTIPLLCAMKTSQFCNMVKQNCVGKYDSKNQYQIVCQNEKCPRPYEQACGSDKCALNLILCNEYLEAYKILTSKIFRTGVDQILIPSQNALITKKKTEDNFKLFQSKIKNCTTQPYEWKLSDMCKSGQNCFHKEEIRNRFNIFGKTSYKKYNLIKIDCQCGGDHTYHCGTYYCSVNNYACESFNLEFMNQTNLKFNSIKDCSNDLVIIEKELSWFELLM